ncbi:MAG: hypothetical protein A2054_03655 [Deltaproteobacteria bacterium GWA2_55_10]|nr:MAG: hypothetical protein A2054_03655 [Deltaproteobacteria bacterium GWA2_55_10]
MIKGINLIPDDIKKGWLKKKVRKALLGAGIAYFVLLGGVVVQQRSAVAAKRVEAAQAAAEKEGLLSKGSGYLDLSKRLQLAKQSEAELSKKLGAAAGLSRIAWSNVLKRISNDVPEGLWLRGVSSSDAEAGGKRIRVLGSAAANRAVADFIFTLENSGYFSSVTLAYTQKRELEAGHVYDFEVYMNLRKNEDTTNDW